jgi:3-isopropylmalate dehydrogenase
MGIFPGEGVGPEVIAASLDVLDAVESAESLRFARQIGGDIGLAGADDGTVTENAEQFCREIFEQGGAILCGPGGGRFVYDLRGRFDLFCKLVPLHPIPALHGISPLKPELIRDVDILVVRDGSGGIYQGKWGSRQDDNHGEVAEHSFSYTEAQVERIVSVGVRLAQGRRGRIDVIVKDGGVPTISDLWRRTAERVADAAGVRCVFRNADFAAYALIRHPQEFDVLVTPNLLGDMLADLGAVFLGSRGLSFSGNFSGEGHGVFQTGHGAAYDLAGTDQANPAGQILSLAMMLRESYGLDSAARRIESAVNDVFAAGFRSHDVAEPGCKCVGTRRLGELIAKAVSARTTAAVPA